MPFHRVFFLHKGRRTSCCFVYLPVATAFPQHIFYGSVMSTTAMATHRNSSLAALQQLPSLVREATRGLQEQQLNTPYREGGWTVRQIVHHIADAHTHGLMRMKFTLTETHPTLTPYNQDLWALLGDSNLPLEPSFHIISGIHTRMLALLINLPNKAWERTAYHPDNGIVSLESIVHTYAHHGEHHVAQITSLRERMRW